MTTEKYILKPINNSRDLNNFLLLCSQKYGKIINISLPEIGESGINDISKVLDKMNSISLIKITIISEDRHSIEVKVDIKNWTMEVNSVNMKNVKVQNLNISEPKQTLEEALSDPKCTYYRFDNGLIAKYDNNGMYYRLNKNNEWVNDQNILARIVGSEYDYEIINSTSKEGTHKL